MTKTYRVIVAGGRDFNDKEGAFRYLDYYLSRIDKDDLLIIEGGNRGYRKRGILGADQIGMMWAVENGVELSTEEADWDTHGRAAGYIRNSEMGDQATHLIAFWDGISKGTKNMIDIARKKGLNVRIVRYNSRGIV